MDAVVLVPVLNRPQRVAPLIESFLAHSPARVALAFVVQEDDEPERAALEAHPVAGIDLLTVPSARTTYPQKINDAFAWRGSPGGGNEPLVICAADDVLFAHGWLDAIEACIAPGIGVIGTRDGGVNPRVARGTHSCHSAVLRSYIDEHGGSDTPGEVLHEGYRHTHCDDELVQTARARRAFVMSEAVLEHLHPYAKTAPMDDTYRLGMASIEQDRRLWARRRRRILGIRST